MSRIPDDNNPDNDAFQVVADPDEHPRDGAEVEQFHEGTDVEGIEDETELAAEENSE